MPVSTGCRIGVIVGVAASMHPRLGESWFACAAVLSDDWGSGTAENPDSELGFLCGLRSRVTVGGGLNGHLTLQGAE